MTTSARNRVCHLLTRALWPCFIRHRTADRGRGGGEVSIYIVSIVVPLSSLHFKYPEYVPSNCFYKGDSEAEWLACCMDSGAEEPEFRSQPLRCMVTVLGKLFTPILPLFTKQQNW